MGPVPRGRPGRDRRWCALAILAVPWFVHIGRGPAGGRGPAPLVHGPSPAPKARPLLSESLWPPFSLHPAREGTPPPLGTGERRPAPADRAGDSPAAPRELVHVREYLDNPQLRRIFLVSDLEDGSAQQQVASVVEQTTRFNFYKITISQGIVIDPRHPDRATVFALVVGPRELESLRDRLRAALKDRVEETTVEPAVVTQLADIGEVEACPPSPAAEMAIPRDAALAFRDPHAAGGGEVAEAPPAELPKKPDRPTLEQERSSPVAEIARPGPLRRGTSRIAGRRPASGGSLPMNWLRPSQRVPPCRPRLGLPATPGLTRSSGGPGRTVVRPLSRRGCRPGIYLPGDTSGSR